MGKGVPMEAHRFIPFIEAIKNRFPALGITVAGGLGPYTTQLVEPLIRRFPDLSVDAQGQLRPSKSALDPIDWDLAQEYLVRMLKLCA